MSKKVVLCIDDEEIILNALDNELSGQLENCVVEFAQGGQEALKLIDELTEEKSEIAVALSDFIMPGMKGDEFLTMVHQKLPSTQTIMLTGQSQIEGITRAINGANLYRFIAKPWDKHDLLLTLKSAVGKYEMDRQLEQQEKIIKQLNERLSSNANEHSAEEHLELDVLYDQVYFHNFFHSLTENEKKWTGDALIAMILSDGLITKKELEYIKVIIKDDRREEIVKEHMDNLKKMILPELLPLQTSREKAFLIFKNLMVFQAAKEGINEAEKKKIYQIGSALEIEVPIITQLMEITKTRIMDDFRERQCYMKLVEKEDYFELDGPEITI